MLRAASKTIQGYGEMHLQISELALEGIVLSRALSGDVRPDGWTKPALHSVPIFTGLRAGLA